MICSIFINFYIFFFIGRLIPFPRLNRPISLSVSENSIAVRGTLGSIVLLALYIDDAHSLKEISHAEGSILVIPLKTFLIFVCVHLAVFLHLVLRFGNLQLDDCADSEE